MLAGHERKALRDDVLTRASCGQMTGPQLVFVNGHDAPELSALQPLPEGVIVGSLAQAISTNRRSVEPHLACYASFQNHAFVALNTAFMAERRAHHDIIPVAQYPPRLSL